MSVRAPPSHAPVNHSGLVVQVGNGYERMVMTAQEITDDVLATIPKLKAAANRDTFGRRWKQRRRKNGVDMFELVPGGGDDPDDDLDIAHALVAKTELKCHLNEVLNVLVNTESSDFESSMRSLCGSKFKSGQVLFQQRRKLAFRLTTHRDTATSEADANANANVPQDGLVGVQLATLRPKLRVKVSTKHKRTQRLCFASCTQQYPSKDRVIHVMKTIPKEAHDQIVSSNDRTALRRELDHIAVGFDIQSKHGGYGASTHSTRVFVHTYASTVSPVHYGRHARKQPGITYNASDLGRRREAIMNPEAHHVLDLLTKSLREFETVIRRRRFGFQTFMYFPTMSSYPDAFAGSNCSICQKHFSFFRRDFFCQLCGNMVCRDCSQLYEVEARIGEVRKNRCCIQCVVRVDACVFDDEDMLPALGPLVVDADDASWYEEPVSDDDDTVSLRSNANSEEITDHLFSTDPSQRSQALEMLAQLVGPQSSTSSSQRPPSRDKILRTTSSGVQHLDNPEPRSKTKHVLREVEYHLSQSLRQTKAQYSADECVVYEGERDYAYQFDPSFVNDPNTPLAPVVDSKKEAKRLKYIKESGVLEEKYDRSALDLLAQVAAKRLNCPIGFVSVIDETQFRAIGTYQFPEVALALPRDENLCVHSVYAEKPMVIKNPQRDMRFAQMGCIKDLGVKFYAGFPVCAPDGSVVATLCTGDVMPHSNITTKEYATMEALSKLAADLIIPKSPAHQRQPLMLTNGSMPGHHQQHSNGNGSQRGSRAEPYLIY